MRFETSRVEFSLGDLKSKVKIPPNLTIDLAEFIGIMVGDGHVAIYHRINDKRCDYDLQISGHINDRDYNINYINNLIFKLFNIKFNIGIYEKNHIIILRKRSKAICKFLKDIIGLPPVKDKVTIPSCILNSNKQIKAAFLRGLADSDFCYTVKYKPNKYPVIHGTSKSKKLIEQCSTILNELGIQNNWRKEIDSDVVRNKVYVRYRVYINGFERVKLFMEKVSFNNENKLSAYRQLTDLPKYKL